MQHFCFFLDATITFQVSLCNCDSYLGVLWWLILRKNQLSSAAVLQEMVLGRAFKYKILPRIKYGSTKEISKTRYDWKQES